MTRQAIIFLGPPGVGKGTIGKNIQRKYGVKHISVGDIIRNEISAKTDCGIQLQTSVSKGMLINSTTLNVMITKNLQSINNTFILDGFPRTMYQYSELKSLLSALNVKCAGVCLFSADKEVIMQRLKNRASQSIQSEIRHDDTHDIHQLRYMQYLQETVPLIEMYRLNNLIFELDASQDVETITNCTYNSLKNIF